jgi:hypothetical protein
MNMEQMIALARQKNEQEHADWLEGMDTSVPNIIGFDLGCDDRTVEYEAYWKDGKWHYKEASSV